MLEQPLDMAGVCRCRRRVRVRGRGRRRRLVVIGPVGRWRRLGRPSQDRVVLARLNARHRITRARRRLGRVRRRGIGRRGKLHGLGRPRRLVGGVNHRPHQQRHQHQPRHSGGHDHLLLVMPTAVVVTAHAGMLSPAGQDLLRTSGKRTLQERPETDPSNTQRPERRRIVLIRQRDRVDRQWQLGRQAPQRIRIVTAHWVQRSRRLPPRLRFSRAIARSTRSDSSPS